MCVCVRACLRARLCLCVRERERVCVCVCACVCVRVYQEVLLPVRGLDERGSADVGERERKWRVCITANRCAPGLSRSLSVLSLRLSLSPPSVVISVRVSRERVCISSSSLRLCSGSHRHRRALRGARGRRL